MREHHTLGTAGRARGEKNICQVVLCPRGGQRRRRVVGEDVGPQGIDGSRRCVRPDVKPAVAIGRGLACCPLAAGRYDQSGQRDGARPRGAEPGDKVGRDDGRFDAAGRENAGLRSVGPVGSTGT